MENDQNNLEQPTTTSGQAVAQSSFNKEKLAAFYKQSLPQMLKTFFSEPISGTFSLLSSKGETSYFSAVVLIATTAVLYVLLPYMMLGDARSYIGFGPMFKVGLAVALLLLIITTMVFGIKSISGKPDFKNELLTGALCGIPLSLLVIAVFVVQFFSKELDVTHLFSDRGLRNMEAIGLFAGLLVLYIFLMLINIVQQSLKSAGTKDALAWYISPIVIIISIYAAEKIGTVLF